ncbi:MAG: hypothetical protein HQL98_13795 [Magnetococcales bacterium]|nr:hypothetical protein [Magnetococcales bacterium]
MKQPDGQGRKPHGDQTNKRPDGQPGKPDGQPNKSPDGQPNPSQPGGVSLNKSPDGQPNKHQDRRDNPSHSGGVSLNKSPEGQTNNPLQQDPLRGQQPARSQDAQQGRQNSEALLPGQNQTRDRVQGEFRQNQSGGPVPSSTESVHPSQGRSSSGGTGQRVREAARPPVQVSPATSIVRQPDKSALTIQHRNPTDGTETRVISRVQSNGRQKVTAYQNLKDPETKTRTRIYNDGRRIVFGKNFVTRSTPGRPTMTTFSNGLREAMLPDRRRYFKDEFSSFHDHGHERKVIHRTVYVDYSAGRVVELPKPIVRVYEEVPVQNVVVYAYKPAPFKPTYYTMFSEPFIIPLEIGPSCLICPPPMLTYIEPVHSYATPMDLLVDMLLAGAVNDSYNNMPMAPSATDSQVNALSATVASLQQELTTATSTNETLREELADQQNQLTAFQSQIEAKPVDEKSPMPIPEPVRKQFRNQVEQDLIAHQNSQPLALTDLLKTADAQNYIFQVAENMDATDVVSGEECMLTTGDLISIDQLPEQKDASARMRVVTSNAESCRVNNVVTISLWNLQEMLNAYRQRLEDNMQKVHQETSGQRKDG